MPAILLQLSILSCLLKQTGPRQGTYSRPCDGTEDIEDSPYSQEIHSPVGLNTKIGFTRGTKSQPCSMWLLMAEGSIPTVLGRLLEDMVAEAAAS